MFVYSDIHNYKGRVHIKQILVFPTKSLKDQFDKTYKERVKKDGIEQALDSNAGALYKLIAAKNNHGGYVPIIRCGSTDSILWNGAPHPKWKTCLLEAHVILIEKLMRSFADSGIVPKLTN